MWIDKVHESLKDELEMTVGGDITAFFGIDFKCLLTGAVEMLQLGLTEQVLKTKGMQDFNPDHTPASQKPVCCCIWWQIPGQKLPTQCTNVLNSPMT